MRHALIGLGIAVLPCASPAVAQDASGKDVFGDPKAAARVHFQEGLALAQRGELALAVAEFEAAYAASPHHSVLYNIAQTEAARGRFVQAVAALERYLSTGGREVPLERRDTATKLIAQYRKSIGNLALDVEAPERTRIWLDGTELKGVGRRQILPLATGNHVLIHVSGRSEPVAQEIVVTGGSTRSVRLQGEGPAPADSALAITCNTPDVSVSLDGAAIASTPVAGSIPVASGSRRLVFARPGYRPFERLVYLKPGGFVSVDCNLQVQPHLPETLSATLTIRTSPPRARTLLNGTAFTGSKVPVGRHELLVEHDGYLSYRSRLSLAARSTHNLSVVLTPTPAKLQSDRAARARRQNLALGLGGSGLALLLGSGGLAWWNDGRFEDLQNSSRDANPDPNRVIGIQRVDDLAIGLAVSGLGLVLGGAWVYWFSDEN